jgi:Domain of unknown function (DUF4062)/AAA domain, putative AbiEii toxin, Type IV TA system
MVDDQIPTPPLYQGVMISSTFTDLQRHREELMEALRKEKLFAVGMEEYVPAPADDVISSSLKMVGEASGYIGLISHRYGQVVEDAERNPHSYSVSRLEFEEAQRLGLPTLVFIMGDDHPVKKAEVETDPENLRKLADYRERAKQGRIYVVFDSLEDFTRDAIHAVANLRRHLEEQSPAFAPSLQAAAPKQKKPEADSVPPPPAFYAEPPYIGSHEFVGRRAELERLSDWAAPADPHPVLLFEAIGGAGKSMLTWEWTNRYSTEVRKDWAGRFWYSFYERGAIMADFCRRALAYITGQPLRELHKKKTLELGDRLLRHLQERPWLLILDGLERVLVAYHRFDAAQLADEDADVTDQIARRDPRAAIRPEDDDLLRALAAVAPSKLLLTSRLIPRVLLNAAGQPIIGVLHERLPGLRPTDAEALFRSCGVTGDSQAIQDYLKRHCDCHPLVIGVLGGLVNNYLPDRGNFNAWAADTAAGGRLNLADLDLVQKRNHILLAALADLPEKSLQLLSVLALLSEAVDYATLSALNPHLPPEPEEVKDPADEPENGRSRERCEEYEVALQRREEYKRAVRARLESPEFLSAPQELSNTVRDLERRGLLQYDYQSKRYDLHPIVRGLIASRLPQEEKEHYGQRVVEHFSHQSHSPYAEAETLEDLSYGINLIRTLLQMGKHQQAADVYCGNLSNALFFNVEAHAEILSLLRPFFPHGWTFLPQGLPPSAQSSLTYDAARALLSTGEVKEAVLTYGTTLLANIRQETWADVITLLSGISAAYSALNRFAKEERCRLLEIDLATLIDSDYMLFNARLGRFLQLAVLGRWSEAEEMWQTLDPMGRDWPRVSYRPGDAEYAYALFRFWRGELREEHFAQAELAARAGKNRPTVRALHRLRGEWRLEQGQWATACESLHEAVRMAHEVGLADARAEAQLALAKFSMHQHVEFNTHQYIEHGGEAQRLSDVRDSSHRALAELWLAVGDHEQARRHALTAYKLAWADGEPYVHRYELDKATALLKQLGAEIPVLAPYDPATDEKLLWEDELAAAVEHQYAGFRGDALLAGRWEEYLHGRRSRHSLPMLAKGFPALRVAQFRLRNIGVFEDTGTVNFTRDPMLLLGNNAAGKSTILKCLALAAVGSEAANEVEVAAASYLRSGTEKGYIEVVFDLIPRAGADPSTYGRFAVGLGIDSKSGRFTALAHSDMTLRPSEQAVNCLEQINALRNETNLSFGFTSAYGATRSFTDNRFAEESEHSKRENEWVLSLFHSHAWLMNPDSLGKLLRGDTRNIKDAPDHLGKNIAEALQKSLLRLLPNVERMFSEADSDITLNKIPLRFRDLSEGYRSVLAFIGHMVRCALRLTVWADDPFKIYGIALVDEIESHLHPAWQKHIIADLHGLFPNVQWICSSHSALVAGALVPNSILLLEPVGGHAVPRPIDQSFKGWRADQILTSLLFGLETSQDEETARFLRRYRELALSQSLGPEEEQEFLALGEILGVRVPTVAERAEAREAMKIFDVTLNELVDKKTPEELQRLNDELLLRLQDTLSD